ncbi:MAG: hypothetical protein ACD_36C00074G0001 [uncultured bacterium]|nr:MAG: hypothetical protein ACD_36C00074G0001 [uncultured bacterium]
MNVERVFLKRIDKANLVCQQHQICNHDHKHHKRVLENALVINSILPKPFNERDIHTLVLGHDIGYSCQGIVWVGKNAINHAQRGNEVLKRAATIFLRGQEKIAVVALINTLPTNTKEAIARLEATDPLPAAIKLADCLDYFHTDRVKHVPQPYPDEHNYYFLAKSVTSYTIHNEAPKTLAWTIDLKPGVDKTLWESTAQANFQQIFTLAELFAQRLHFTFRLALTLNGEA